MAVPGAKRPLKVANVIEDARIGGPQRRILAVAEHLAPLGIETIVYTAEQDVGAFASVLDKAGIPKRTFPLVRLKSGITNQLRYAADCGPQIYRYWRALRADRPDVVHANSAAQWRPVVAARLLGIPCVWHLNDTSMPAAVRLVFRATRWAASGFIVSGLRTQRYYLPSGPSGKPLWLIPPPVDASRFPAHAATRAADTDRLPSPRVVTVGNVNPDKGLDTFVATAHALKHQHGIDATFIQVGGRFDAQNAYIQQLEQQAKDLGVRIHFLGHRGDVADILRSCDVYLHTARNEASGMAVWEALTCGLPVVTTDVADYAELCSEQPFALIAPIGDAKALATHLASVLSGATPSQQLVENGRALIADQLNTKAVAMKYLDALEALAKKPAGKGSP